jgi:hypothetical protein
MRRLLESATPGWEGEETEGWTEAAGPEAESNEPEE